VNAYLDNTIDVQSLLEDSDTKTAALERVAELEEALSFVSFASVCLYLLTCLDSHIFPNVVTDFECFDFDTAVTTDLQYVVMANL